MSRHYSHYPLGYTQSLDKIEQIQREKRELYKEERRKKKEEKKAYVRNLAGEVILEFPITGNFQQLNGDIYQSFKNFIRDEDYMFFELKILDENGMDISFYRQSFNPASPDYLKYRVSEDQVFTAFWDEKQIPQHDFFGLWRQRQARQLSFNSPKKVSKKIRKSSSNSKRKSKRSNNSRK